MLLQLQLCWYIQSDQGSEFNNLVLRGILDAAPVKQSISSSYHPMSHGSIERFNGTMKTYLSRLLKPEEENQWDMVLNRIEFAYNVSVHGSTLLSPFKMLYRNIRSIPWISSWILILFSSGTTQKD